MSNGYIFLKVQNIVKVLLPTVHVGMELFLRNQSSVRCGKRKSRDFKYVRKGVRGAGAVLFRMMRWLLLKMRSVLEAGREKE